MLFNASGGPVEDERTFRMNLSLPFFDGGWWVLQNSLFSASVVVCWSASPASGKLWHICVEQPLFYRQKNAGSFQISDVIPHMCVISCSCGSAHMFFTSAMVIFGSLRNGFTGSANLFLDLLARKENLLFVFALWYLSELWSLLWFIKASQWYLDSNITKVLKLVLLTNA